MSQGPRSLSRAVELPWSRLGVGKALVTLPPKTQTPRGECPGLASERRKSGVDSFGSAFQSLLRSSSACIVIERLSEVSGAFLVTPGLALPKKFIQRAT